MVKLVGMPIVFWIGSVWAGAWDALLAVVLLSALFIGLAIDSSGRTTPEHSRRRGSGRSTPPGRSHPRIA